MCLFFTPAGTQKQAVFSAEYYKPSTSPLDFSGSYEDKQAREFNFKNWNPDGELQLVNWFGLLILSDI